MTLQQLRYITMVAEKGTISEAAKELFISQPSLTNAIRELEQEMQVTIFHRTNKGVTITAEGDEFLAYARQILDQVGLMQERYLNVNERNPRFSVSCQHYSFAVNAFVDVIRKFDARKYDFTLRETQTYAKSLLTNPSGRMHSPFPQVTFCFFPVSTFRIVTFVAVSRSPFA